MASSPGAENLRDVRALAQKLWAQCMYQQFGSMVGSNHQRIAGRDSPSSYKLLTTAVRRLRNVLEEAEEIFDETRTLGPDDYKLLEKVSRSGSILHQLDLALQSYRCSNYINVNENAIADFKTVLDVTIHELSQTYEAITTGDIPLRLDTDIPLYGTAAAKSSMGAPSSSSNATDSAHDRKSSYASSAWSLVPRGNLSQESASDAMSVRSESKTERLPSDDKELYNFAEGLHLQTSSSVNSTVESRRSLDWRSPFASPDPLSLSMEQASAWLLAEDDEFVDSTVRSRSGTGSTLYVDARATDGLEGSKAVTLTTPPGETLSTSVTNLHPSDALSASDGPRHSHKEEIEPAENLKGLGIQDLNDGESSTEPDPIKDTVLSAKPQNDSVHLSPKFAAIEFARRRRNSSISSVISSNQDQKPPGEVESTPESDLPPSVTEETSTPTLDTRATIDETTLSVEEPTRETRSRESLSIVTSVNGTSASPNKPLPPQPAFEYTSSDTTNTQIDGGSSPSMPTRRPPPPPPKPRCSSGRPRASSYRIVNASPVESPSTDDELYTTSKPSSPVVQKQPSIVVSTEPDIPKVSIDASACEDDNSVKPDIAATDSVAQSSNVTVSGGERSGLETLASALKSKFYNEEFAPSDDAPKVRLTTLSSVPRRHSIAVPPSQENAEEEKPTLPPRPQPPPIPNRPKNQRYNKKGKDRDERPAPSTIQTSPAAIQRDQSRSLKEKELAPEAGLENLEPESGLELNSNLNVSRPNQLPQRISVDAALNVETPTGVPQSTKSLRDTSKHLRSASTSQVDTSTSNPDSALAGFYGPGIDSTTTSELEMERINHIMHFWNSCQWDQAEAYLSDYLTALIEDDALARARRVRHLLGVCASFKGEWLRAIPLFLSVLRTPIQNTSEIDDGDCAAAYWLGDTYSLLNRRTEALLAYCVAERSSFFNDPSDLASVEMIATEQEAVRLALSETDMNGMWSLAPTLSPESSILDQKTVVTAAAKTLLETGLRNARMRVNVALNSEPFKLSQSRARSHSLLALRRFGQFHRMKINAVHFKPDTPWPMLYDPLFCMANVQRGRLLAYECDMAAVFATNSDARIPKAGPLGLGRMDSFTCSDLTWLIQTIRDCLKMFEMQFSEVANVEGSWFVARYSFLQNKIATTYYFSIALFKQTFRAGYGVEICPDGICSARICYTNADYDKGVHISESKRIKKMIREHLDEAAKQRPKSKRKESASGTPPQVGAPVDEEISPPVPRRPQA